MKFKQAKQWNVVLVQNTGKTVRMSWHTCIIIIGCMILVTAASTAGVMKMMMDAPSSKDADASSLSSAVSSEPALQESLAANSEEESIDTVPPVTEDNNDQNENGKTDDPSDKITDDAAAVEKDPKESESETGSSVAIQNPSASFDKKNQILTFRFKIKNLMETQASGHAVVILKRNPERKKTWITLPDNVPLIKGKPDGETEGNSFSISNYKVMRFAAKKIKNPKRYNIATIFIFDKSGTLIVEEDHPLTID